MDTNQNGNGLWKGVFVGGLLGASAAILLAPMSGEKLRAKVRERLIGWSDSTEKWASGLQEKASDWADTVREDYSSAVQNVKQKAAGALESVRTTAVENADKLKSSDNSSLAQNEEEMKKLGKEMDQMKTGSELRKDGFVQDPIQKHDHE